MVKKTISIRLKGDLRKTAQIYAILNDMTLTELIEKLLRRELEKDPDYTTITKLVM